MSKTTFIASGDAFITRRIAENGYAGFAELAELIKTYDVRFSNLEMTFHDREGVPSAVSGGLGDALHNLHIVDIESADGVTTVIRLFKHFFGSYQWHIDSPSFSFVWNDWYKFLCHLLYHIFPGLQVESGLQGKNLMVKYAVGHYGFV